MATRVYLSEELLGAILPEQPAGRDLRFEPIFSEILEARREDDVGGKSPQWAVVADRSLEALQFSKDIRLCCFVTEAAVFLDGFAGLRDCLRLTREVLVRFWDHGLLPLAEDGDLDYRSGALAWFNDRMPDAIQRIPITVREDKGEDYTFSRYLQAQRIGTHDGIQRMTGEKREAVSGLLRQGWITLDAFDAAIRGTKRAAFEVIYQSFDEASQQFVLFERTIDEKLGAAAPGFSEVRTLFENMRLLMDSTVEKKREEEPMLSGQAPDRALEQPRPETAMQGFWTAGMPDEASGSWQQAEALVRTGKVDKGLQKMATLAANETSGRGRFLRKLMLVDVCRNAGREKLARTILEELNSQIVDYKLDHWESSALVGAVWSRLYRLYKRSDSSSEQEQAAKLYNQLCRLDPWQTYIDCED
jgi:type VI secretion system protein ImpA